MKIKKQQAAILDSQLSLSRFAPTVAKSLILSLDDVLAELADALKSEKNAGDIFTRQQARRVQEILRNRADDLARQLRSHASTAATEAHAVAGASMVEAKLIRPPVDLTAALSRTYNISHQAKSWPLWATQLADDTVSSLTTSTQKLADTRAPVSAGPATLQSLHRKYSQSAQTLAATLLVHQAGHARQESNRLFGNGQGQFVRYSAILDDRTSFQCAGLDGTIWRADDPTIRIPPIHPNCRSTLLYFLTLREAEEFPRATFAEYLEAQDRDFQKDFFGPSRYSLYRKGLPLNAFSSEGEPLTLEQILLRYPDLVDG